MKRILILGSHGMAGHIISKYLELQDNYVIKIARTYKEPFPDYSLDIRRQLNLLSHLIVDHKPDVVINCIGILIPDSKKDIANAIFINSYFPHWLKNITKNTKTKIIHLSTDCVFDGKKGNYRTNDIPTETSIYGRTKALGEINNNKDLTIRMSIIGKELKTNGSGLFEWVMKQKGTIKGFSNHYWNGITTLCLAQNINKTINSKITGLYQLAPGYKITKYSLLKLIKKIWNKNDITIQSYIANYCDKTLKPSYRIGFEPIIPESYKQMLVEMREFDAKYKF